MFISIKRFLDSRPEQLSEALLRMVRLILQGIELHAVKGDAEDYERFRADVRKTQDSLGERPVPSEVLVAAGTVVKALEDYNRRTSRFIHIQCSELQAMVGMLTKAMATYASGSETGVARLQTIERQLQKASMVEDFQTARLRLSECLEGLRGEIVRQKEHSARAVSEMRTELVKSQERLAPSVPPPREEHRTDTVTGLPGRSGAETLLLEISQGNRPVYAVLLVVERLELINMRFGYSAGDQVLLMVSQHVAQHLSRSDALFRWSGPSLLALLERRGPPKDVREEVERVAGQRLEKTVTVVGRTILLPVAINSVIFPVADYRPVQLLFQQFDLFVQGNTAGRTAGEALSA
jgi:GGDEF domain-containing protein